MMNLTELSDSQASVRDLARQFTRKSILPKVPDHDEKGLFPKEIFQEALKAGLLNLSIPDAYGGAGLGHLESILVAEEFGWACVGIGAALSLNGMIADAIELGADEGLKKKYLGKLVNGSVGGFGLTEPGAGSDVAAIKTTAEKKGGDYVLSGSKTWISNATVADFFVVFAKTDPSQGHRGITAFLVDKDTPGFKVGNPLKKMGQRAFPAAELFLDKAKIPAAQRIGAEGSGFLLAMKVFDRSRPMIAALGVGLATRCLDECLQYASTREAMGVPIIRHEMVAQKIADMGMRSQAARLLTYESCDLLDKSRPATLAASYAKTFSSDTAVWAASEAIQVFGGMGYSPEYPVEKLYRDSKVLQIYEGTNEIQRLIMVRELQRAAEKRS